MDLVDAVDPHVDFSQNVTGPPLGPFVDPIYEVLTSVLTASSGDLTPLAVRGLSSLATRSPSALLDLKQVEGLVVLFTTRLRQAGTSGSLATNEEENEEEEAEAILRALRALSRRRPEYTTLLQAHTLPALIALVDAAMARAPAPGPSRPHPDNLTYALKALGHLSSQPEVFSSVLSSLMDRILLLPPTASQPPAFRADCPNAKEVTPALLAALASIFNQHGGSHSAALPALLDLPQPPTKRDSPDPSPSPYLWYLVLALLNSGQPGEAQLDEASMESCMTVLATVTEQLDTTPAGMQDMFVSRVIHVFYPPFPILGPPPNHSMRPDFQPFDKEGFQERGDILYALAVVVGSLNVQSTLLQVLTGDIHDQHDKW